MPRLIAIALLAVAACHHDKAAAVPPAPAAPTCQTMSEHVEVLLVHAHNDGAEKLAKVALDHCTKDTWPDGARKCIVDSQELSAGHHCLDQLPPEQHATFMADMDAVVHPKAAVVADDDFDDDGMPAECHQYHRLMDAYFQCDKIPQAARDAAKQGFDVAWSTWKDMPAEGKQALGAACKAAADAARSMTCPP